ncbi:MAG: cation-translocating P-type ATPase [Eubacterium aggregans]|uniref:cation-translocating P-type ATPase n=1 Tax=Eubacterium aggregans TaxID=81409 RepID=UPI002B21981E|nr:cation-translocating P-type ATPase [Eubacterium aggregans]MEA5074551.1 cation-translocating P-type ATPase [Eubacterium aggregans]
MQAFRESAKAVLSRLGVDPGRGLTPEEAEESRAVNGANTFTKAKAKSVWKKIWDATTEPMIIMLLTAAAITLGVNFIRLFTGGETEFIECVGIFAAIFLAVGVTVIMEGRSEKAFDALNKINEDVQVKVLRGGGITLISQKELVVGDIMEIATGDMISADARLLETQELRVDESSLTGESNPVKKDGNLIFDNPKTPVAERVNMLYSGCFVTGGSGVAVVTAVGDATEFGSIARELSVEGDGKTPLQEKLDRLGKLITILGATAAAIVFTIQCIIFLSSGTFNLDTVSEAFITSIVLIVAAVPEGLPTIVAVSLSLNIIKMARQNALVKKLIACETIGCINVICSDKTGTLTENRMTVTDMVIASHKNNCGRACVSSEDWPEGVCQRRIPASEINDVHLIENFILNSTADIEMDGETVRFIGNPTECALITAYEKYNGGEGTDATLPRKTYDAIRKDATVSFVFPFSSETKNMTTIIEVDQGFMAYSKGSPEKILSQCAFVEVDGVNEPMNGDYKAQIEAAMAGFERKAKRVLAFCHRPLTQEMPITALEERRASIESDMVFDGFVAIADPLRGDVYESVARCRAAGIELKMLTGDNSLTAQAIAEELGILKDGEQVVEAVSLEDLTEDELKACLPQIRVIARSTPTVKMRVVSALKELGNVVAVTGDGINDAPAIKKADVGIAMGITGTEVSKEASDIVLLDDSFSTIVKAVQWGRGIFENFQRFIQFQLTVNLSSVIVVLTSILLGMASPFSALQLLWINIIMDGPPALTLGLEPIREDLLGRRPIPRDASIVNGSMMTRIASNAVYVSIIFMLQALFNILGGTPGEQYTILFTLFVVMHLFNAFNSRELTPTSIFKNFFNNRLMLLVFGLTFLLQVIITQYGGIFYGTIPLSLTMWLKIIGLGLSVIVVSEVVKAIQRGFQRKKG